MNQSNLHHLWSYEQARYAICIEKGSKMTDKAIAMIGGNFPLDDNIVAGRSPRNACKAGKIAEC